MFLRPCSSYLSFLSTYAFRLLITAFLISLRHFFSKVMKYVSCEYDWLNTTSYCSNWLLLPSMKCIRALFSVCLSFFLWSRSWSWCECGERSVGTGTDGTPAGGVWLGLNVCFFSLENQEHNKARASRSRASLLNTAILYFGTEWYASTAVR